MGVILSFLGTAVARIFADKILSWIAIKAVLVFLSITVLPIILNNFMHSMIEIMMNFAATQSSGASSINGAMSFTGVAGWLLTCFKLPEVIAVYVSALSLRLALSMIPFVRLVG